MDAEGGCLLPHNLLLSADSILSLHSSCWLQCPEKGFVCLFVFGVCVYFLEGGGAVGGGLGFVNKEHPLPHFRLLMLPSCV